MSAQVKTSSVSLFLEKVGSTTRAVPVGTLSNLTHETSPSYRNPEYRAASTPISPAPHHSSAEILFSGWLWKRVETAICFRGCCLLLWVVPWVLGPKADKSRLLVILESIGLLYKAQVPAFGALHENSMLRYIQSAPTRLSPSGYLGARMPSPRCHTAMGMK